MNRGKEGLTKDLEEYNATAKAEDLPSSKLIIKAILELSEEYARSCWSNTKTD